MLVRTLLPERRQRWAVTSFLPSIPAAAMPDFRSAKGSRGRHWSVDNANRAAWTFVYAHAESSLAEMASSVHTLNRLPGIAILSRQAGARYSPSSICKGSPSVQGKVRSLHVAQLPVAPSWEDLDETHILEVVGRAHYS